MNKKAVSLMLSYVILIVIAISLSIGVYSWLRLYANVEEIDKCPEDVSLIIQNYNCNLEYKEINLTVKNKGLFNLSGFIVRGTNKTDPEALPTTALRREDEIEPGGYYFKDALAPNGIESIIFSFEELTDLTKIQIEPFRIQENKKGVPRIVLCDRATITQEIVCEIPVCWEVQTDVCVEITCPDPCNSPYCYSSLADCNAVLPAGSSIPDSPISWWRFDESAGSTVAVDSGDGGNDIDNLNGAGFQTGKIRNALATQGSFAQINPAPINLKLQSAFTIEAWVKIQNSYSDSNTIIGDFEGINKKYSLSVNNNGKIAFYWVDGEITSTNTILIDSWNYFAVTKSGTNLYIYINDNNREEYTITDNIPLYSDLDYIAIGWPGSDLLIDELAIYNEALDVTTIQQHYQNTADGSGDYFTSD